jgi:hypothetical protein
MSGSLLLVISALRLMSGSLPLNVSAVYAEIELFMPNAVAVGA